MKTIATFAALIASLLLPAGAGAAAGSLDHSFSGDGRLRVQATPGPRVDQFDVTGVSRISVASAAAPDDELVVASDRRVLRYRADGRPRAYFGGNGQVVIPVATETSFQLAGIGADSRGRVLVAGTTAAPTSGATNPSSAATVYRFLPSGALDRSFGDGGLATIAASPFGGSSVRLTGLALDSAGRAVLTGFSVASTSVCGGYPPDRVVYRNRTFVLRLNGNGAPDHHFGTAGFYAEGELEDPDLPAIFPSGRIVFANRTGPRCPGEATGTAPGLTALSPGGLFEHRFPVGPDGSYEHVESLSVAVDTRNRVVVLVLRAPGEGGGGRRFQVRRYLADGTPDPGFGAAGTTRPQLPPGGAPAALVTDGRNRVVLAGSTPRGQKARAFLALRLNAAGKVQRWFGDDGWAIAGVGRRAKAWTSEVHRDSSGRIVLGGIVESRSLPTGYDLAFARLLSGGR
ncbi:MAG: hypothetical protein R2725_02500 [Solirubrobacterales bacterium]